MSNNNMQSNMRNVGSNLNWPVNYAQMELTSYDVYSVSQSEKHHRWCTQESESIVEKLLVAIGFLSAILVLCFAVLVVF
jgi:hypothetical protein